MNSHSVVCIIDISVRIGGATRTATAFYYVAKGKVVFAGAWSWLPNMPAMVRPSRRSVFQWAAQHGWKGELCQATL